ncbi:hypothetical protein N476_26405 [Pseudoalteromonas luteoviolacea H33]|uniref:Uncharacterized protein n=1 Tax=Pseudoalteromonas luteoviolacea H33 TaxID=1365251 RepID=A0A167GC99_9GAMM|nr:hypothetical protein N476_26405 [Pseudoalteromonas luteoviolacea H33]KZN79194.1 hypothetical protein N477_26325 [Pseudoalteromonas luteoviolacea H33-S]
MVLAQGEVNILHRRQGKLKTSSATAKIAHFTLREKNASASRCVINLSHDIHLAQKERSHFVRCR